MDTCNKSIIANVLILGFFIHLIPYMIIIAVGYFTANLIITNY